MSTPILDELINSLKSSKIDQQLKIICDQIMEEEKEKMIHKEFHPSGINIFLIMELSHDKKEMFFLTLEREFSESYVIRKYSRGYNREAKILGKEELEIIKPPFKIIHTITVKSDTVKKILSEYAIKLKFENGD